MSGMLTYLFYLLSKPIIPFFHFSLQKYGFYFIYARVLLIFCAGPAFLLTTNTPHRM